MSLKNFTNYQELFNSKLKEIIYKYVDSDKMREMIMYSVKGGKRLRPILAIVICLKLGGTLHDVIRFAIAIELIHTSSLIIDDLPCMDNDFIRRGQPSLHAKYSVTKAQVLSSSITSIAVKLMFDNFQNKSYPLLTILNSFSKNIGILGAAGGQLIDITPKIIYNNKKQLIKAFKNKDQLKELFYKKTTSFFEMAFLGGYLCTNNDSKYISKIINCAKHFGFAFQIYDDFDDIEQDKKRHKLNLIDPNFVNNFGETEALIEFDMSIKNFKKEIKDLELDCIVINELTDFLESKVKKKYKNIKEE